MVTAALGLGAAACGSGSPSATGHRPLKESPQAAILAAYRSSVGAKTVKFAATMRVSGATPSPVKERLSGESELSGTSPKLAGKATVPVLGTVRIRLVNGVAYVSVPVSDRSQVPSGKSWISVNLNQATGGAFSSLASAGQVDPSQSLVLLEARSNSVKEIATATVRGTPTTEYHAILNLDKVAAQAPPAAATAVQKAAAAMHTTTLPVNVWLDAKNRVRQVEMTYHLPPGAVQSNGQSNQAPITVHVTGDLFGYGTPVSVTAPPPAVVYQLPVPTPGQGSSSASA